LLHDSINLRGLGIVLHGMKLVQDGIRGGSTVDTLDFDLLSQSIVSGLLLKFSKQKQILAVIAIAIC